MQRRVEAWLSRQPYQKRYQPVPLSHIATDLHHAVIAAEDARFYQHFGFDFKELHSALERAWEDEEAVRVRGASTLTQQLIKNLFLTTHRSVLRKVVEASLVPPCELILGKQRILELYLNVVEWGPGVYGAEAAARYHYGIAARALTREQAARLAACLPNPRRRRPQQMDRYAQQILRRMQQMGW